ncbi:MAG: hypothetical protein J0J15_19065, partial [Mesorhizobium sp.]|nr:hypothetical protein [Mesorhizobium sp.]
RERMPCRALAAVFTIVMFQQQFMNNLRATKAGNGRCPLPAINPAHPERVPDMRHEGSAKDRPHRPRQERV